MKKQNLNKKLTLNKETIFNIEAQDLNDIKGGTGFPCDVAPIGKPTDTWDYNCDCGRPM